MTIPHKHDVKHAQKESFIRKEVSVYLMRIMQEQPSLADIYITRVALSAKKGGCHIFFHAHGGEAVYKERLKTLVLYKPSLRSALARALSSRYVPEIFFDYDHTYDKQLHIERLIDSLKTDSDDQE